MSEQYNKKELKKQSRDFRSIASRTLTSDFQMFGDNLKRLITFIDSNKVIKNYIESCIDEKDNFNVENDVNQVCSCYNHLFESYIGERQEVSYIYQILKYIVENNKDCRSYTKSYSSSGQYQDKLKSFCDNVIEPFINYIDSNYERIFIEMGLDEETNYYITNNGGQVNISKDNSVINATQNNYSEIEKLINQIKNNIKSIDDSELRNEIIDNIDGLSEEIKKINPKKGIINSIISGLKTILPKIGTAVEVSAAITELITFAQSIL